MQGALISSDMDGESDRISEIRQLIERHYGKAALANLRRYTKSHGASVLGAMVREKAIPKGIQERTYAPSLVRISKQEASKVEKWLARIHPNKSIGEFSPSESLSQELCSALYYDVSKDESHCIVSIYSHGMATVLVVYQGDSSEIFLFDHSSISRFSVYRLKSVSGDTVTVRFVDVTKDGNSELFVTGVGGSGKFMDAAVVDLRHMKIIWYCESAPSGAVSLLNLDEDDELEIIQSERTDTDMAGIECNQCSARRQAKFSDYDRGQNKYVLRAVRVSAAATLTQANGPLGVSDQMMQVMLSERAGGNRLAEGFFVEEALQTLRNTSTVKWTVKRLQDVFNGVATQYELLIGSGDYRNAAQLMEQLVLALEKCKLKDAKPVRMTAVFSAITAYMKAEDVESASRLAEKTWFIAAVHENPQMQSLYYGRLFDLSMLLGDVHRAYQALIEVERIQPEAHSKSYNSMLAEYYNYIGDYQSAYASAVRAVDSRVLDGVADAASAAGKLKKYSEAIDWLGRGLSDARTHVDGNAQVTHLLQIAADIALEVDVPKLAIALLDEALLSVDPIGWRTHGGSILLAYAITLNTIGDPKAAKHLLLACVKAAKKNSSVHASALYQLSRMAKVGGDLSKARQYAREAFDAIALGRKSISLEQHKFSFLADKKTIAMWYFGLEQATKGTAEQLFDAVESWKMQTFLDLYGSGTSRAGITRSDAITAQLRTRLSPNDVFVDYVVGDEQAFAITFTREQGARVIQLTAQSKEITNHLDTIRRHLDIHNPQSLRDIRNNFISSELMTSLKRLYAILVEPLDIPISVHRILISPDEQLFGVPWPALWGEANTPIIEHFETVLVPSARLALQLDEGSLGKVNRREKASLPKALIVGALSGVDVERVQRAFPLLKTQDLQSGLPPLTYGERELIAVSKALPTPQITLLLDQTTQRGGRVSSTAGIASSAAVLEAMEESTLVHIVAHGVFNQLAPMKSGLFLEPQNDSGMLEASRFLGLNLAGVELVSLAACETAIAGKMPGAEALGFLRPLLASGVKSVLLTEWEVDDKSTSEIIIDFYKNIGSKGKSAALREAQRSARQRHRHPYFWAGITLHGGLN